MAYRNFKFKDLEEKFGIIQTKAVLFENIQPKEPSDYLKNALELAQEFVLLNEKSLSEFIVAPILAEIKMKNKHIIELYSGSILEADKANGLNGECDFILAKSPLSHRIKSPIITIVEAKRGEIELSVPQVAAQMLGAQIFNQNSHTSINCIYGAVTTGRAWQFVKLENKTFTIDTNQYVSANLRELLGVLQTIIDFYK